MIKRPTFFLPEDQFDIKTHTNIEYSPNIKDDNVMSFTKDSIVLVKLTDAKGEQHFGVNALPELVNVDATSKIDDRKFIREFDIFKRDLSKARLLVTSRKSHILITRHAINLLKFEELKLHVSRAVAQSVIADSTTETKAYLPTRARVLYNIVSETYSKDTPLMKDIFRRLNLDNTFSAMRTFLNKN